MILMAFSEYLRQFDEATPPVFLLSKWIKKHLEKEPDNNISKVIQTEISLEKTKNGKDFILIANSKSGQKLIKALYNFALSYEHQSFARWVHQVKSTDFNKTQ